MSLYIGNDATHKIMHVTSNEHTIAELKSGILADTVFHSNLNYVYMVKHTGNITNSLLTVSQIVKDLMTVNPCIIQAQNGTWLQPFESYVQSKGATGTWISGGVTMTIGYPAPPNGWPALYNATYNGTCNIFIAVNVTASSFTHIAKSGSDIVLGNQKILIGGFDILNTGYVQRVQLNNVDDVINMAGEIIQITNTSNSPTSMSLKSWNGRTQILRNDVPIIDTAFGTPMEYKGTYSLYLDKNGGNTGSRKYQTNRLNFGSSITKGFMIAHFPGQNGISALGAIIPMPCSTIQVNYLVAFEGNYELIIYVSSTTTEISVTTAVYSRRPVSFPAQYMIVHLFY